MTRVALIGSNGFGIHHRRIIAPLHDAGAVELVGLCDLAPVHDEPGAPVPERAVVVTDYRDLLASTKPDVAIIATPPHTHVEMAIAAARAGADVLVEKPPFLSLDEHASLAQVLAETGRVCQVGFQALASPALAELIDAIQAGRLGTITGIGAYGAWQRPDSYYDRAPWAGRRTLGDRPILDGALANPFAHAVMEAIAVASAGTPLDAVQLVAIELERYRARPIEVDDTGAVRLRLPSGLPVVVAVTLCADERIDPVVLAHGSAGQAELAYTRDRLRLPGDAEPRQVPGRVSLLENLIDHRTTGAPLVADVARTAPFTAMIEKTMAGPEPRTIDPRFIVSLGSGAERVVTVPGSTDVVRRAAYELRLPTELGVPW